MVTIFRVFILYILVITAMRIMGKRQIGELQPYELVTALMLSELAALPMQDSGTPLVYGVIPIVTLIIIEILSSYLTLRFQPFRKVMCGVPSIIIKNGKVIENELIRQRFNLDDLMEQLRLMGYIDLSDIEYAIMETSGRISVIPIYSKSPTTKEDLKLTGQNPTLPITLILDGKINYDNLSIAGYDKKWLMKNLKQKNIKHSEDVFIALIDSNQNLYIQKRGEENES